MSGLLHGSLVIMLKNPVAGRVKTRLGADIGAGAAAATFRILSKYTIMRASRGPWRTVLAVDPPAALERGGDLWPAQFDRIPQSKGDLGERMSNAMACITKGPVVVIGADAPEVSAVLIREAFAALRGHDMVFGPAEDGGYWLIGCARRRPAPGLFDGVRWSSETTLDDTLASAPSSFSVAMLNTLQDIDTVEDLSVLQHLSI